MYSDMNYLCNYVHFNLVDYVKVTINTSYHCFEYTRELVDHVIMRVC